MTTTFQGQKVLTAEELGALAVSSTVNHVVGTASTIIRRPSGNNRGGLVLVADRGGWRFGINNRVPQTVSAINTTTDVLTSNGHNFMQGDGPVRISATTTIPAGLSASTDYYVKVVDLNNFQLSTRADLSVIPDITSAGAGTITVAGEGGTMPSMELPTLTTSDGSGTVYIREGMGIILPSPAIVTVKGFAADSVLTYWWI